MVYVKTSASSFPLIVIVDFPHFFIVDFPLKIFENIVIVDFPFSFYSGFSFIVDFHGTRICISKNLLGRELSNIRQYILLPFGTVAVAR